MNTFLIFACLVTSILADLEHPQYTFRCLENGGIEILGLHKSANVSVVDKAQASCQRSTMENDGRVTVPPTCMSNSQSQADEYHVIIHVFDDTFDRSKVTTPGVVGGNNGHNFKITCKNIPQGGVTKSVAKVLHGGPNEVPVYAREVSSIEMHFRAIKNINAPDINEISVGKKFFMFLQYKGQNEYKIQPTICSAYNGSVVQSASQAVSLWDITKPNQCAEHKELLASMEYIDVSTKKEVVATMYGFHFTGSSYLTINCKVTIFPTSLNNTICPTIRRKRESLRMRREMLDTPFHSKSIIGKLKVTNLSSGYSSSASNIPGSSGCFKFSAGIMIVFLSFRGIW